MSLEKRILFGFMAGLIVRVIWLPCLHLIFCRMILQLVEEGKLELTDTLDKFFPQVPANSTLQGIWRALSIPGPANHAASAASLPQEA
jgi:hypothetical protein